MPVNFPRQYEIFKKKADAYLNMVMVSISLEDQCIDLDIIFFHLQQAAEKYLKTLLSYNGVHFEKMHDIQKLISICHDNSVLLPDYIDTFIELNPYAVEGRYAIIADDIDEAGQYVNLLMSFKLYIKSVTNP